MATYVVELGIAAAALHFVDASSPWLGIAIIAGCLGAAGLYRRRLTLSVFEVAPRLMAAATIGATAAVVVGAPDGVEFTALLTVVGLVCGALFVGRFVAYSTQWLLRRHGVLRRKTIVLGAGPVGGFDLAKRMHQHPQYGLEPVAILDVDTPPRLTPDAIPVRSLDDALTDTLGTEGIDALVLAFPKMNDAELAKLVHDCGQRGCEIWMVSRLWDTCPITGRMDHIGPIPLQRLDHHLQRSIKWRFKLLVERCLAAAALMIVSPLLGALAAMVKISDPTAPVLFRQKRVGLDGTEFELHKFRSMSPADEAESQTHWCIDGDPRVGALGRFLRASSLDELPQLWNIVRGDMVLIGPRPERKHFVAMFSASVHGYSARHRVPGGMTGWAAVNGLTGDTSIAERANYDNFYIANWSFWLDVAIVFRTIWILILKFFQACSPAARRVSIRSDEPSQAKMRMTVVSEPAAQRRVQPSTFTPMHPV
ncbi:hypothetical protein A5662_07225 [Mycobacteriaceae bacterium 1482268.1]|nr:hypothetical protein A5662_07225 [Mycobacteriaceae bacterium 1482268.1]